MDGCARMRTALARSTDQRPRAQPTSPQGPVQLAAGAAVAASTPPRCALECAPEQQQPPYARPNKPTHSEPPLGCRPATWSGSPQIKHPYTPCTLLAATGDGTVTAASAASARAAAPAAVREPRCERDSYANLREGVCMPSARSSEVYSAR